MRALITGITGFVGPHLAKRLLDKGWEVYGLVRERSDTTLPLRARKILGPRLHEVKLVKGDLTDFSSMMQVIKEVQPDVVFHLAAQSFVHKSFLQPIETTLVNCLGTQYLLEALRLLKDDVTVVFAGSSEEYGLQIIDEKHYERMKRKYGAIVPKPYKIPELPIDENNPLRPQSPYAVTKVFGDLMCQNYAKGYGMRCIVSRGFNHEGPGRGPQFVTSTIVIQSMLVSRGEKDHIELGNVNAFRDWSHVSDIVDGYIVLAERGTKGDVYVLGSRRTNSVLTFLLLTLENLGYKIKALETLRDEKRVEEPAERIKIRKFGLEFPGTRVDKLMLEGELEYEVEDKGLRIETDKGEVKVIFDPKRFRPAEVPILLSNPRKAESIGYRITKTLDDIIRDMILFYHDPELMKSVKG